jgi:hypothetical protein
MISKPETDQDSFCAGNAEKRTIDDPRTTGSAFIIEIVDEEALT